MLGRVGGSGEVVMEGGRGGRWMRGMDGNSCCFLVGWAVQSKESGG